MRYKLSSTDVQGPTELADIIISSGIEDNIWDSSYTPKKGLNFRNYLRQRIKNERARKEVEGLCREANERMEKASKKLKVNP